MHISYKTSNFDFKHSIAIDMAKSLVKRSCKIFKNCCADDPEYTKVYIILLSSFISIQDYLNRKINQQDRIQNTHVYIFFFRYFIIR